MVVGTAIPESRITAQPVLVNDLRQNVSIYDNIHTTLIVKLLYIMISYAYGSSTLIDNVYLLQIVQKTTVYRVYFRISLKGGKC